MLKTNVDYQHVIQVDQTKTGVEVYAIHVGMHYGSNDPLPLLHISEDEKNHGKYLIRVLSDKVNIIAKDQ